MKTVIYRETYQKTYEAEGSLTDTQAVTNVRERIMEGESGPEECVDSGGFVALPETPKPGETCCLVPFAYERYGKLPVIVPTGTPLEQIWSKAEDLLDKLPVDALDYYSSYLPDSEEVDEDGPLFQRTEDGDVPFEVPVDPEQDMYRRIPPVRQVHSFIMRFSSCTGSRKQRYSMFPGTYLPDIIRLKRGFKYGRWSKGSHGKRPL